MKVKIKSYKPHSNCYTWYGHLIGQIVNVKRLYPHNQDFLINDENVKTCGTIWDCAIHESDVEIIEE